MSRAESHSHAERWQGHSLHAVHVLEERIEEMERDVVELIRQRDEAVEQRDQARETACRYEALLAKKSANGIGHVYTDEAV